MRLQRRAPCSSSQGQGNSSVESHRDAQLWLTARADLSDFYKQYVE